MTKHPAWEGGPHRLPGWRCDGRGPGGGHPRRRRPRRAGPGGRPGSRPPRAPRPGARPTSSDDNAAVVAESHVVVLAVKPALVTEALLALGGPAKPTWHGPSGSRSPRASRPERCSPPCLPVRASCAPCRTRPALVGCGATGFCASASCTPADREAAMALFEGVGMAWEAPDEHLLDAVTGLSGSGPAYVFLLLEGSRRPGPSSACHRRWRRPSRSRPCWAPRSWPGDTGQPPAALRERVTSPGGLPLPGSSGSRRGSSGAPSTTRWRPLRVVPRSSAREPRPRYGARRPARGRSFKKSAA